MTTKYSFDLSFVRSCVNRFSHRFGPVLDPANDKARDLRRMQLVATGCVAAAFALRIGVGFLADSTWIGYLCAFSEAAVVGGLADWFAVTALFRYPLGLPIPHTGILPKGKDRIATSLSNFVVANFLNCDVVERELLKIDLSVKGAGFLDSKADAIAARFAEYLPRLLHALDDADISRFLEMQFVGRLREVSVAPVAGRLIELITSGDKHERLVNDLLKLGGDSLLENRDVLTGLIRREIPLPDSLSVPGLPIALPLGAVKERLAILLAEEAMKRIQRTIDEVRVNPEHEIRARIRERITRIAMDLKESPKMLARGEEMKEEFLANPNVAAYASRIWSEIKAALIEDAKHSGGQIREHLASALRRMAAQVKSDGQLREKFNIGLRAAALDIIAGNTPQFARFIEETVARWDGEELSRKLELEVGRDLQFVRLNGTLVGGLIGAGLHFVMSLI